MSYLIDNSKPASETLPVGTRIQLSILLDTIGVYILEINDGTGSAIINTPVYVGDIYPLLPDYKDLAPKSFDKNAFGFSTILSSRRFVILDMVNKIRKQYGAEAIFMDSKLNELAQNFSQSMINGNFFGHYDLQGRSPSDRSKAAGIFGIVGENLALNINLTEAQLSLERSPAHLRNMVKGSWTRVGLGIAQNAKGSFYLTQ